MKKYILLALLLLSVLVPFGARAESESSGKSTEDTIAALQRQVAELLAKIERLKAEKSTPAFCFSFNRDLTVGSRGDDVVALRKALKQAGIEAGVDGEFDEDLAAFIVKFQGKHGIRQTGYVGPLTRAKLNRLHSCDPAVRAEAIKDKKESKHADKKVSVTAPVISKLESGALVSGSKAYVVGSSLADVKSGTLVSSSGQSFALEIVAKEPERLKFMVPSGLAAGDYTLSLTNPLGTGSLKVEVKQ